MLNSKGLTWINTYNILKTTSHQKARPLHCLVSKYARVLNATIKVQKHFLSYNTPFNYTMKWWPGGYMEWFLWCCGSWLLCEPIEIIWFKSSSHTFEWDWGDELTSVRWSNPYFTSCLASKTSWWGLSFCQSKKIWNEEEVAMAHWRCCCSWWQ